MHTFLGGCLPQLTGVFVKYNVSLELDLQEGAEKPLPINVLRNCMNGICVQSSRLQLEERGIHCCAGACLLFSEPEDDQEEEPIYFYEADYWQLLAPCLTSLTLKLHNLLLRFVPREKMELLLLLHNLEVLELTGGLAHSYNHCKVERQTRQCERQEGRKGCLAG